MKARKGITWYLVNGMMELSWFLAWAMFCSLAIMHRPFPFFETLIAFALAGFVTHGSSGKGWRMVWVFGLKCLGFMGAALLVIHGLYYGTTALLDREWLVAFFTRSWEPMEWIGFLLNLLLITILWTGGVTLARRPKEYYGTCNRFDLGLAAFFALFILKLIIRMKGGVIMEDSLPLLFVFPFFLFGLAAIGMARIQGSAVNSFLPGYRGIGVIASFVTAVLLATGGLLLFFLPALTAAAQVGYHALTVAGRPIASVVVTILRFIFGARGNQPPGIIKDSSPVIHSEKMTSQEHSWWMELLGKVLGWGLGGLLLLALLFALAIALFYITKWLLAKTATHERRKIPSFLQRFIALGTFLTGIFRKILRGIRGYRKAAELYGALLGWAGRSGFPRHRCETPLEFGSRLNTCFPTLKPQITLIIGAYNREVYGETHLGDASIAAANAAWRFLRSPLRWPARLRVWLGNASSNGEEQ